MTRWLVSFDDAWLDDDDPQTAAERWCEQAQLSPGATVYAINLDAIVGTDRCVRFRMGSQEIPEDEPGAA